MGLKVTLCMHSWSKFRTKDTKRPGNPTDSFAAAAAAAAKSLQSCLTLCDPIDRSPPGSLIVQLVKNPPVIQETLVRFLDQVDPVPTIWFLLQNLLDILLPTSVVFLEQFSQCYLRCCILDLKSTESPPNKT